MAFVLRCPTEVWIVATLIVTVDLWMVEIQEKKAALLFVETFCTFTTGESNIANWNDELCYYDLCSQAVPNDWYDCIKAIDIEETETNTASDILLAIDLCNEQYTPSFVDASITWPPAEDEEGVGYDCSA